MAVLLLLVAVGLTVYGVSQLREASRIDARASTPAVSASPIPSGVPPARVILDERYARGELDTDEYLHRVETLRRADGWVPVAPVPGGSERPTAPVGASAGDGEATGPEDQV